MSKYCCKDFEKLIVDYKEAPMILKEDLRLEEIGYHEPIDDDVPTDLKFSFCPFCGNKLVVGAAESSDSTTK